MKSINKIKRKLCCYLGSQRRFMDKYRSLLKNDPLNEELHFQFGIECLKRGNYPLATAEFKTSIALGKTEADVIDYILEANEKSPQLISMDHNTYYRFISLQKEIESIVGDSSNYSILDIGGGEGGLSRFLKTNHYCLVEPDVNGVSGIDLPFEDKSFDIVVSCHVLEHIPPDERKLFLNQLCSKAKKSVILLNPFKLKGISEDERLQLHIDITDARWAKEHLECTLPTIEFINGYAREQGYACSVSPNGSLLFSFACVYIDFFAQQAPAHGDWRKVNEFMNKNFTDIADVEQYPNAYLIHLSLPKDD